MLSFLCTLYPFASKIYLRVFANGPSSESRDVHPEGVKVYLSPLSYSACILTTLGARSGVVVKALRYKPAGRGFDSR